MYIGKSIRRIEDPRFLTGRGRYVDDIVLPDTAHAAFVRSPHAHALIRAVRTGAASAMPGVLAVLTGRDWENEGLGRAPTVWEVTSRDGSPMHAAPRPMLVADKARHVGDTIALVVAEDRDSALEAAEAVEVDFEPLPAVVDLAQALEADAPCVHDSFGTNLAFDWEMGERKAVDEAFGKAAYVTELELVNNRLSPCPMEPRATLGSYDRALDRYTLWTSNQAPHLVRQWLAENTLRVPEHQIRVVAPDVGGGFGQKIYHYPEEPTVLWASRKLGRPVRWTSTRSENFLVDAQARDHRTKCRMAFDRDGKILAIEVDTLANLGAYHDPFASCLPTYFYAPMLCGLYTVPTVYCHVLGVYTTTTPVCAYRGVGRSEAAYVVERLIENAARELKVDSRELRRRNVIRPEQIPYASPTGVVFDAADVPGLLDKLDASVDFEALRLAQRRSRETTEVLGIGLAAFFDAAGAGPSKLSAQQGSRIGFWESAAV
ncbi:MAG TPA: xanthine dehydrogenase family protein molybdopterin-binding subunit, partial [Alphaproteobacteria bacterium]|nr:xanthine dehydrogenase family protein molybdopterin-binding subunit [Alphaproteobacteria bacterium]